LKPQQPAEAPVLALGPRAPTLRVVLVALRVALGVALVALQVAQVVSVGLQAVLGQQAARLRLDAQAELLAPAVQVAQRPLTAQASAWRAWLA